MPTYTLRNIKTNKVWDVNCSWDELQTILDEMPDVIKELSTPKIVSGVGSLHSKVPDGFRDKLNQIKKGSGQGNTIKT
jgi:hypothetical protein